jgi:hypothetical protein
MRENGLTTVEAVCEACKHEAVIKAERFPAALPVPDVALRLRCSVCRSKRIVTRPNWIERG